jgi:cysteine-rich repeat protein
VPQDSDRPPVADDGADKGPIYLALTHIHLGSTNLAGVTSDDAWQSFGLDLDNACTNSSSCADRTEVSCRSATTTLPFDGRLCRDNTLARLQPVVAAVPEIGVTFGLGEDVFNCAIWRGTYNDVFRITGYNGQPDDSRVRVDYYRSPGIQDTLPWRCEDELDSYTKYPRWRSSLSWRVIDSDLAEPAISGSGWPDSLFFDAYAYVKSGYVVARVPNDTITGFTSDESSYRGFQFKQQQGYFLGRIALAQDGTWGMRDGLLAGRIRKHDLVQSFRDVGFCEGGQFASFYTSVVSYIDENADLLASGQSDSAQACDAMSFGIAFEAAQVQPGTSVPAPKRIECCPPDKSEEDCAWVCGDGKVTGDETCDTAISSGQTGACPTACPRLDSCTPQQPQGDNCHVACAPMPITAIGAKDACCPSGATAQTDSDCMPVCGNGVVERGETCDPPESCMACTTGSNACRLPQPAGAASTCNLRCDARDITVCVGGDGCCPSTCTDTNDSDCSAMCGNSRLDRGETCEAGTSTPCPTSCDDKVACTRDTLGGSATNCNVLCENTPISVPANGDGCCPTNANSNNDSDCSATCGNKIIEAGEQCDDGNAAAGDGCVNCQTETPEQTCLVRLGVSDACAQCSCSKCNSQTLACQGATNAADAKLCNDMVLCARMTGCRDPDCICGRSDVLSCLAGATDGPCVDQVTAAARSSNLFDVQLRASDTAYPLGRANALGSCVDTNCKADCGL